MDSMQTSKVTIAVPTRNRAEYLRLSIASALAQTYPDIEVLVSDNVSTDHTQQVLASFSDDLRVRVIRQSAGLSMVENWNACLSAASGKYFLLLSDDDLLEPTAIEEMVAAYEDSERKGNKIGFVYCNGTVIDGDGKTLAFGPDVPAQESAAEIIVAFFDGRRKTWACAILFRREDLAPGYDERFSLLFDAALWMRVVALYGSARFLNRRLTRNRVHQNATIQARIASWHNETIQLSEFAIDELRKHGVGSDELSRAIRKSVNRSNIGVTAELINRALRHDKRRALKEYWTYRRMFASGWGFLVLVRGLILLMLPDVVRKWIGR